MITLSVCGVAEVPFFVHAKLTDIVSIGDPGTHPEICSPQPAPDFTPFANVIVHRYEFQDVCHVSPTSPTKAHIQSLIDLIDFWLQEDRDIRVLFHCQAGASRSTAAAFITCVRAGMDYQAAYAHVRRVRGYLIPNLLMIKYADQIMNQGGKMLEFIAQERDKLLLGGEGDGMRWVRENGNT